MRTAALALTISLVGCGSEPSNVVEAKGAVTALLRDPGSALFSDIDDTGPCVRGKVNSKNGFGGYAGASDFVYDSELRSAVIDPGYDPASPNVSGLNDVNAALTYRMASLECTRQKAASMRAANQAASAALRRAKIERQNGAATN